MYNLICFLLPSFISIKCEEKLLKEDKKILDLILNYGIYILLNNTLTSIILTICYGINYNYQENINLYSGVAIKYTFISIIIAIALALIKIIIVKNLEVKIEVENK